MAALRPMSRDGLRGLGAQVAVGALVLTLLLVSAATGGAGQSAARAGAGALAGLGVLVVLRRRAGNTTALILGLIFAVILLLPEDYVPVGTTLHTIRIDPVVLLVLLGLFTFERSVSPEPRPLWPRLLATAVLILGALTYELYPGINQRYYFLNYLVVGLGVFAVALRGAAGERGMLFVSSIIATGGLVAAAVGLLEYVDKRNPVYGSYYPPAGASSVTGAVYFPAIDGFRITTTIGHPLVVAAVLGAAVLVAVGLAVSSPSRRTRLLGLVSAVAMYVAICLTKSRTGIVLTPALVLAYGLALPSARRLRARILAGLIALGIVLFLTRGIWISRFSGNDAANSTEARASGLQYTRQVLPSALPFGLGYGAAEQEQGGQQTSATPEDSWLELLVDGGPLLAVSLFGIPLVAAARTVRTSRSSDPLRLSHGAASLYLALYAFSFNGLIVSRTMIFVLMAQAGVAAGALRSGRIVGASAYVDDVTGTEFLLGSPQVLA